MSDPIRLLCLILAGKGRGLAQRALARLPAGGPLSRLPPCPPLPEAAPLRRADGTRPMKVLVAGHSLNLEGAPLSQLDLVAALAEAGGMELVVASVQDGPLRREYERLGIPVRLDLPGLGGLYTDADFTRAALDLGRRWRDEGIDAVLAVTLLSAPAIEAARLAGIPALWNPRESVEPHLAFRPFGAAIAARALACLHHPAATVFVARSSRALWAPLDDRRFHIIANALPPWRIAALSGGRDAAERARLGLAPHEVMVLVPGTVCERKGQRDLARALERLAPEARAVLRVVCLGDGDGRYARALDRDRARLPPGLLRIEPAQADPAPWYRAADVVALPSRSESAPRVVLEALAAGIPLLVSPVFGIAEQVPEGCGALHCPPGDTARLAGLLSRLALDPALRQALAEQARRRFAQINDFPGLVEGYRSLLVAAASGDDRVRRHS
ncbi:MAG: glycosyltransferase family 4 protein [Magnetospirillum sp.]|nr:glycosyltransferase family 4 protein [Magnetospirillum sp.]